MSVTRQPEPPPGARPARIGPYDVLGLLGRGGAGTVYRARDPKLRREVALKLLGGAQPGGAVRFQREAEALARLRHPNIVRVHTFGDHQGVPYLVMDLIDGAPLAQRIEQEGPLPLEEALRIARSLSSALEHVHAQGLVHRDLKPDNVLLDRAGEPLLTDFGLVKAADAAQGLSREGALLGTPGYWPPEQARGQLDQIGPASDIYGWGATLYAMLTGAPPIRGRSLMEVLVATLEQVPPAPSSLRADVPSAVDRLCARCLAKRPADRYPVAASVTRAVDEALAARPSGLRRRALAGGLVLGVVLAAGVVGWRQRSAASPAAQEAGSVVGQASKEDAWLVCLRALTAGEDRGAEAEALLVEAGSPAEAVWGQLAALPAGRARSRLQLLACLLSGRDEQALAVAVDLDASWQQVVELGRDLHALCANLDDLALTTQGAEKNDALVAELERALDRARRLRRDPPEPLAVAAARRWQAGLAHSLARLRAVQGVSHDRLGAAFFDRGRALAPESREASYLDVIERWLIQEREVERAERARGLDQRLSQAVVDAGWDPLFVFLRGFVLLESDATGAKDAGELACRVADQVSELHMRYAGQWLDVRGSLSMVLASEGGDRLVRSQGGAGREALAEAFRLAISVLLGPGGAQVEVPALEDVEAAWLRRRLTRPTRDAVRGATLALLGAGRPEPALEISRHLEGEIGFPLGEVHRAEALLQLGQLESARGVLEGLRSQDAVNVYRDFWGALAHARALTGDASGAAEALSSAREATLSLGLAWYDPEHVPALLAGRGWWPGQR